MWYIELYNEWINKNCETGNRELCKTPPTCDLVAMISKGLMNPGGYQARI